MINKLFLGVGAMKAGTTWLYSILNNHPELYFTYEKEIHFWDQYMHKSGVLSDNNRLKRSKTALTNGLKEINIKDLKRKLEWYNSYLGNEIDLNWYQQLFALNLNKNSYNCDFSNLTCHMNENGWSAVRHVAKEIKVIYILRDPLKRLWSHIKFHNEFSNVETNYDEWTVSDYTSFSNKPFIRTNDIYSKHIKVMQNSLSNTEFKIFFFEDFRVDPAGTVKEVENFLGIANHEYAADALTKQVNVSKKIPLPDKLKESAKEFIEGEYKALAELGIAIHPNWSTNL